jgi:hypothetical protein
MEEARHTNVGEASGAWGEAPPKKPDRAAKKLRGRGELCASGDDAHLDVLHEKHGPKPSVIEHARGGDTPEEDPLSHRRHTAASHGMGANIVP